MFTIDGQISTIVHQLLKLQWKRSEWAQPENYVKFYKLRALIPVVTILLYKDHNFSNCSKHILKKKC